MTYEHYCSFEVLFKHSGTLQRKHLKLWPYLSKAHLALAFFSPDWGKLQAFWNLKLFL